jgi:hypothetical protein
MPSSQHDAPSFYLLQDSRDYTGDNLMFWASGGGYTSNIALAELFSESAAFQQHESRHSDVPWPVDYIRTRVHRVVDMQYVKVKEAQAWPHQASFYCQSKSHGYVGNDLVFRAEDGKGFVIDLNQAKVVTREEALFSSGAGIGDVFWPSGYIDFLSRIAANRRECKVTDALKPTGRELIEPKRQAPDRYRCHSCSIFLKAADYYGYCPRCGTDNSP